VTSPPGPCSRLEEEREGGLFVRRQRWWRPGTPGPSASWPDRNQVSVLLHQAVLWPAILYPTASGPTDWVDHCRHITPHV
jgi:hypothetical protein